MQILIIADKLLIEKPHILDATRRQAVTPYLHLIRDALPQGALGPDTADSRSQARARPGPHSGTADGEPGASGINFCDSLGSGAGVGGLGVAGPSGQQGAAGLGQRLSSVLGNAGLSALPPHLRRDRQTDSN